MHDDYQTPTLYQTPSPEASVEFDGNLLMAGSGNDALFRLYDVLWNETIADLEVNEGASETWSLPGVSQDGDTFSLPGTPPTWLSVSGTDLVATDAPDVNADQNHDVQVRATRDGINVDETDAGGCCSCVGFTDVASEYPSYFCQRRQRSHNRYRAVFDGCDGIRVCTESYCTFVAECLRF